MVSAASVSGRSAARARRGAKAPTPASAVPMPPRDVAASPAIATTSSIERLKLYPFWRSPP